MTSKPHTLGKPHTQGTHPRYTPKPHTLGKPHTLKPPRYTPSEPQGTHPGVSRYTPKVHTLEGLKSLVSERYREYLTFSPSHTGRTLTLSYRCSTFLCIKGAATATAGNRGAGC